MIVRAKDDIYRMVDLKGKKIGLSKSMNRIKNDWWRIQEEQGIELMLRAAGAQLRDMDRHDWLVITSPGAVRSLLALMQQERIDLRQLPRLLVCGTGTARELAAAGLYPAAMPEARYSADSVARLAAARIKPGQQVLRVRSDIAGPALSEQLTGQGLAVTDCVIYDTIAPPLPEVFPASDAIFFASASAVRTCVAQWARPCCRGASVWPSANPRPPPYAKPA